MNLFSMYFENPLWNFFVVQVGFNKFNRKDGFYFFVLPFVLMLLACVYMHDADKSEN
jgi:hypothetical protein